MYGKADSKGIPITPLKNNTSNYTAPSSKRRKVEDSLKKKQGHWKIIALLRSKSSPWLNFVHCEKLPAWRPLSPQPRVLSAGPVVAFPTSEIEKTDRTGVS